MKRLDGKFSIDGERERIVNTVTGVPIPDDEPVFLLRARDQHARRALQAYLIFCREYGCQESHLHGVEAAVVAFQRFLRANPDRMKEPGVTGDIRP